MGKPAPLGVNASGAPASGDQANAVISGSFAAIGPGRSFAFLGPMNLVIYASFNATLTTTANSSSASVSSGTGIAAGTAINSVNVPRGTTWATFSGTSGTLAFPTVTLTGFVSTQAAQITGLAQTSGLIGSTVTGPGIPANTTVLAILTPAVAPTGTSPGVPGVVSLSATPTASTPFQTQPQAFDFALTNSCVTGGTDSAAIFTGAGITYSGTVQLERSFDGGATWLVCNIGGAGALAQYTTGTPVSFVFGEPEMEVLYRLNCIAYSSGAINYRISATGQAATSLSIASVI